MAKAKAKQRQPEIPPALLQLLNTKPGGVAALMVAGLVAAPWWVPRLTQLLWDIWHGIRGEDRPPDVVFDLDQSLNTIFSIIPGMAPVAATSYCQLPDGTIHHRLNISDDACAALGGTNVYPAGRPDGTTQWHPDMWQFTTFGAYKSCRRKGGSHDECKDRPGWPGRMK